MSVILYKFEANVLCLWFWINLRHRKNSLAYNDKAELKANVCEHSDSHKVNMMADLNFLNFNLYSI
jgi:hypothetical protein